MACFHHLDGDRHLIVYCGFGHFTGTEMMSAEAETRKDPRRWPGMRILIDLREVAELDFSLEDMQRGIEMNSHLESSGWELEKTAILIRGKDDEIGAGLYEELAVPNVQLKMGTFRTLEPALAWLGLAGDREGIERLIKGLRERFTSSMRP